MSRKRPVSVGRSLADLPDSILGIIFNCVQFDSNDSSPVCFALTCKATCAVWKQLFKCLGAAEADGKMLISWVAKGYPNHAARVLLESSVPDPAAALAQLAANAPSGHPGDRTISKWQEQVMRTFLPLTNVPSPSPDFYRKAAAMLAITPDLLLDPKNLKKQIHCKLAGYLHILPFQSPGGAGGAGLALFESVKTAIHLKLPSAVFGLLSARNAYLTTQQMEELCEEIPTAIEDKRLRQQVVQAMTQCPTEHGKLLALRLAAGKLNDTALIMWVLKSTHCRRWTACQVTAWGLTAAVGQGNVADARLLLRVCRYSSVFQRLLERSSTKLCISKCVTNPKGKVPAAVLSPVLLLAAAGSSSSGTELVTLILDAGIDWSAETLRGALGNACSPAVLELVKSANQQQWQQTELAEAFYVASTRGNLMAAQHLVPLLEGFVFDAEMLEPALWKAAWPVRSMCAHSGHDSPALVQLLLGAHRFSKSALVSGMLLCRNMATMRLLLDAAPETLTSSDLLLVVEAASGQKYNSKEVLQHLLTGVEGVRFTEEQLRPLLTRVYERWGTEVPGLLEVLLQACVWSKSVILTLLPNSPPEEECVKLLLDAAAEPWTPEELQTILHAAILRGCAKQYPLLQIQIARDSAKQVVQLLHVKGVEYLPSNLMQALIISSSTHGMDDAVDALLAALPHLGPAALDYVINNAPTSSDFAKKLLAKQTWTQEQLWQPVSTAIGTQKDQVLRELLLVGQGLP